MSDSAEKALFVRIHRSDVAAAEAETPPEVLSLEEAAQKIAERWNGEEPQEGDSTPEPEDQEPEVEDNRDPLEVSEEADLLPDDAVEEETDDVELDPSEPLSIYDVAENLGVETQDLGTMEVPIKVQGKVGTATLQEVINGYQRQQDYKTKTADLAREREEVESRLSKVSEGLSARIERFDLLATQLEQRVIGDRKLLTEELYDTDPDRYRRLEMEIRRNSELFHEAARERMDYLQKQRTETETEYQNRVSSEFTRLQEAHPKQFGNETKAKATMQRLQSFAEESYGIGHQEFAGIDSAAHIEVLMDAMRWRSLQNKKPGRKKQVSNAPRMGRAGRQSDRGESQAAQRKRSKARLKRTGTIRDAAKALVDLGVIQ